MKMENIIGRDLLQDLSFDTDKFSEAIKKTKNAETSRSLKIFADTFENITRLIALPLVMIYSGLSDHYRTRSIMEALNNSGHVLEQLKKGLDDKEFLTKADKIFKEKYMDSSVDESLFNAGQARLDSMLDNNEIKGAILIMIYYSLVAAWTAFEYLSKDIWISLLNSKPSQLGQSAITQIEEIDETTGLTRKSISVGLLAKYGFDLRNNLGNLIHKKFDFTSTKGILNAYISVFGKSQELEKLFIGNSNLETLESLRNLIAHRAGYVDEEFVNKTHVKATLGQQIMISGDWTSQLLNSSINAGIDLVRFIDDWLTINP